MTTLVYISALEFPFHHICASPFFIHAGILAGLTACSHSLFEFICVELLFYPENTTVQKSSMMIPEHCGQGVQ